MEFDPQGVPHHWVDVMLAQQWRQHTLLERNLPQRRGMLRRVTPCVTSQGVYTRGRGAAQALRPGLRWVGDSTPRSAVAMFGAWNL